MPPSAIDLTTLDPTRTFVGQQAVSYDDLFQALITAASAWIASYCSRTFQLRSYNEVRDGWGGPTMPLRESPVVAVTSLAIDGAPIPPRPAVGQPGYVVSPPNLLVLSGYCFTRDLQNVEIAYSAGYASTPPEVELFCQQIVAEQFRYRERTGQLSIGMDNQTTRFKDEDIPKFVKTGLTEGGWKRVARR